MSRQAMEEIAPLILKLEKILTNNKFSLHELEMLEKSFTILLDRTHNVIKKAEEKKGDD